MKVLLVGNLSGDRQESMLRFSEMLRDGLRARGHEVTLLAPTLRLARLAGNYRYRGFPKYLGYFDKFVLFPRRLRAHLARSRPHIVHIADHANAAYARAARGVPVLVTCHDLLQIRAGRGEFPQQQVGALGRCQQARILAHLARLPHVACVSEKTREDLQRLAGRPAQRISVVPNALNYPYQPVSAAVARTRLPEAVRAAGVPFLLHVGGGQWYKNRPGLLAIYAELRRRLPNPSVLVMVGPPFSNAEQTQASALGLKGQIIPIVGVTNAELEALYSLAEGLIFPSWEEGFGWPVAEAQACGCPVFAADRAPMTQVGGDAAVYFDPAHPVGAAEIIAAAWASRAAQRDRGLVEARRWQPALMFSAYEAIYRELIP